MKKREDWKRNREKEGERGGEIEIKRRGSEGQVKSDKVI